jgi:hypothetical protein
MRDIVFCRRIWSPVRTVVERLTQTDWKYIREAVAPVLDKSRGTPVNRYINTRHSVLASCAYSSESSVQKGEFCVKLRNRGINFLNASSPGSYCLCHVKLLSVPCQVTVCAMSSCCLWHVKLLSVPCQVAVCAMSSYCLSCQVAVCAMSSCCLCHVKLLSVPCQVSAIGFDVKADNWQQLLKGKR